MITVTGWWEVCVGCGGGGGCGSSTSNPFPPSISSDDEADDIKRVDTIFTAVDNGWKTPAEDDDDDVAVAAGVDVGCCLGFVEFRLISNTVDK